MVYVKLSVAVCPTGKELNLPFGSYRNVPSPRLVTTPTRFPGINPLTERISEGSGSVSLASTFPVVNAASFEVVKFVPALLFATGASLTDIEVTVDAVFVLNEVPSDRITVNIVTSFEPTGTRF